MNNKGNVGCDIPFIRFRIMHKRAIRHRMANSLFDLQSKPLFLKYPIKFAYVGIYF